jgi:hypothetical protein
MTKPDLPAQPPRASARGHRRARNFRGFSPEWTISWSASLAGLKPASEGEVAARFPGLKPGVAGRASGSPLAESRAPLTTRLRCCRAGSSE